MLGIDYGSKRVGIALGESEHKMAFPKEVLPRTDDLVQKILELCLKEKVEGIVIGESRDFKGEENKIMKAVHALKENLENETGLPVFYQLEFLTSAEARRLQGKNDMLDASAAALILKSYFDKEIFIDQSWLHTMISKKQK